ncbi:hypothetical protein F4811DRAFT_561214 [Daldinia bambusicola]|nr:hypothetical protein F4811DRAFT_561214 [Daldinia bambusicola]
MATNQSSPDAAQAVAECPKKRLFICCDGTWMDAVSTAAPLTNVARLARCVKAVSFEDSTQILQIVYYQTGIGRGTSRIGRAIDGATGRGISTNIRDAYSFLCHNFNKEKDEIYLVGFSRGAFTACCLARLIKDIGILTKPGLSHFPILFRSWKAAMHKKNSEENLQELSDLHSLVGDLEEAGFTSRSVKIKAIGIWDAVSALGIPIPFQIPQPEDKSFHSVRTVIPDNVDYCYHALSLDERRKHFRPVIWEPEPNFGALPSRSRLKQCWFVGEHGDVGGGNSGSTLLSDTSLIWMIAHLTTAGAEFDKKTLYNLLEPKKLLLQHAAQNPYQGSSSRASSAVAYQNGDDEGDNDGNEYEVDSPKLPRKRTGSYRIPQQQSHTITSTNTSTEEIRGKLSSQIPEKTKGKFISELSYTFMGTQQRRPGRETSCRELVHWSVRLHLRGGHSSPALKGWSMVRGVNTPHWIPIRNLLPYCLSALGEEEGFVVLDEEGTSGEEMKLVQDLLKFNKDSVGEQQTDQNNPRGGKFLQFFRENDEEIQRPRRLYVDPRVKTVVKEMDEFIKRHREGQLPPAPALGRD